MKPPARRSSKSQSDNQGPFWRLAPYGAFGAVLPAILALANQSDAFAFTPKLNVVIGQIIYVTAAALLSAIFPYGSQATPFNATLVGVGFPTLVGAAVGTARFTVPALAHVRGGQGADFSFLTWVIDTFALF
jgi:hypothetical protein